MKERDALLAIYKAGVEAEIEETRAQGRPEALGVLPEDAEADELLLMQWEAATRGSIMLYDGTDFYEKHSDDLALSDAKEAAAFYELVSQACALAAEQHMFAADVKEDLEQLGGGDA
jgi:hypothetical protein